jgi:hypothetical protein
MLQDAESTIPETCNSIMDNVPRTGNFIFKGKGNLPVYI